MRIRARVRVIGVVAAAALSSVAAFADAQQTFPNQPIKFIIPFAAGSATDTFARAVGAHMSAQFAQPVLVNNVPGGSGFIAANAASRSTPDGYTVFVTSSSTHAANKSLFKRLSYDPVADFEPVAKLGLLTLAMITHPSVPVANVREFIAYAKANPGKITFGSGASSSRIAGELLKMMAGIDMLNVPYKSNPQAVTDLVGGQTSVVIADLTVTMPQVRGGRAKGLAVTSAKRSPLAPELPTMAEAGVPGYELTAWLAAYVPARTPVAIIDKLNEGFRGALADKETVTTLMSAGIEPEISTPEQLRVFAATETKKWSEIVKAARIQPE
jgi:tripartite-type tricarboxylate transporter receptor subunit TctC